MFFVSTESHIANEKVVERKKQYNLRKFRFNLSSLISSLITIVVNKLDKLKRFSGNVLFLKEKSKEAGQLIFASLPSSVRTYVHDETAVSDIIPACSFKDSDLLNKKERDFFEDELSNNFCEKTSEEPGAFLSIFCMKNKGTALSFCVGINRKEKKDLNKESAIHLCFSLKDNRYSFVSVKKQEILVPIVNVFPEILQNNQEEEARQKQEIKKTTIEEKPTQEVVQNKEDTKDSHKETEAKKNEEKELEIKKTTAEEKPTQEVDQGKKDIKDLHKETEAKKNEEKELEIKKTTAEEKMQTLVPKKLYFIGKIVVVVVLVVGILGIFYLIKKH